MKKQRRGRGEGCIYFLTARNRWLGVLSCGKDIVTNKSVRRKVYGATKGEVLKKLDDLKKEVAQGVVTRTKQTTGQFLDFWHRTSVAGELRPNTVRCYDDVVTRHIKPFLGEVPLARLTPLVVQDYLGKLKEAERSPRTRQLSYAVLRRALKKAVTLHLIPNHPMVGIEVPRAPKAKYRVWDELQVKQFVAKVRGTEWAPLFVLMLSSGMRIGEALGLQRANVDLVRGIVTVNQALVAVGHKTIGLAEPKTEAGHRSIPIPGLAVEILKDYLEKKQTGSYVFSTNSGKPLSRSNVRRAFNRLMVEADVPKIRIHDLRHTSATLLLSSGTHPKVVQERLGHSQISHTLDIYSHVLPSMQQEVAGKLQGLLGGNDDGK